MRVMATAWGLVLCFFHCPLGLEAASFTRTSCLSKDTSSVPQSLRSMRHRAQRCQAGGIGGHSGRASTLTLSLSLSLSFSQLGIVRGFEEQQSYDELYLLIRFLSTLLGPLLPVRPKLSAQTCRRPGSFRHMGEGDCVDPEGRRLAGLQKLGRCSEESGRAVGVGVFGVVRWSVGFSGRRSEAETCGSEIGTTNF